MKPIASTLKAAMLAVILAAPGFAVDVQVQPPPLPSPPTQLNPQAQRIVCVAKCRSDYDKCVAAKSQPEEGCRKRQITCERGCD